MVAGSEELLSQFGNDFLQGITMTCTGFYGPQGRSLRIAAPMRTGMDLLSEMRFGELQCRNLEMETSGIYLLSHLLGHKALSCNVILANRANGTFSSDSKKAVENLIDHVLETISK